MPLAMAGKGCEGVVKKIGGAAETRRFLENIGFTAGEKIRILSESGGNIIVGIKDSRVAINRDMAMKIIVC